MDSTATPRETEPTDTSSPEANAPDLTPEERELELQRALAYCRVILKRHGTLKEKFACSKALRTMKQERIKEAQHNG